MIRLTTMITLALKIITIHIDDDNDDDNNDDADDDKDDNDDDDDEMTAVMVTMLMESHCAQIEG